jgi:hypothetical protein
MSDLAANIAIWMRCLGTKPPGSTLALRFVGHETRSQLLRRTAAESNGNKH